MPACVSANTEDRSLESINVMNEVDTFLKSMRGAFATPSESNCRGMASFKDVAVSTGTLQREAGKLLFVRRREGNVHCVDDFIGVERKHEMIVAESGSNSPLPIAHAFERHDRKFRKVSSRFALDAANAADVGSIMECKIIFLALYYYSL